MRWQGHFRPSRHRTAHLAQGQTLGRTLWARQLARTKISPRATGSGPRQLLQRLEARKELKRRVNAKDPLCTDTNTTQAYLVVAPCNIDGVHFGTQDPHLAQHLLHVCVADSATPAQIEDAQVGPRHARQC